MSIKRISLEIGPEVDDFVGFPVFRVSLVVDDKEFGWLRAFGPHDNDVLGPEFHFRRLMREATEEIARAAWPSN